MTTRNLAASATSLLLAAIPCLPLTLHGQEFVRDAKSEQRVMWMQMKRDMPQHPSERVQRYAQCIAWAIVDQVPEEYQDLAWEVIVFDTGATNAMVTIDGKIAVFSGLLEVANTPDKLAAVIGHEVGHLTQGHVEERVNRGRLTALAGVAAGTATGFGAESMTGAEVLLQFPYQRDQETEADLVGMTFMAHAGYNPASVLELWRDMADVALEGGRIPEFMSTHPDPELRRQEMARNLAPALRAYNEALDSGVRPGCQL
jgi:predicted Zn-dependent protease